MVKSSNPVKMMNSDNTLLRMQVDVGKAYDLLAMFKEAKKTRIDIQTILDEASPKIVGYNGLRA